MLARHDRRAVRDPGLASVRRGRARAAAQGRALPARRADPRPAPARAAGALRRDHRARPCGSPTATQGRRLAADHARARRARARAAARARRRERGARRARRGVGRPGAAAARPPRRLGRAGPGARPGRWATPRARSCRSRGRSRGSARRWSRGWRARAQRRRPTPTCAPTCSRCRTTSTGRRLDRRRHARGEDGERRATSRSASGLRLLLTRRGRPPADRRARRRAGSRATCSRSAPARSARGVLPVAAGCPRPQSGGPARRTAPSGPSAASARRRARHPGPRDPGASSSSGTSTKRRLVTCLVRER